MQYGIPKEEEKPSSRLGFFKILRSRRVRGIEQLVDFSGKMAGGDMAAEWPLGSGTRGSGLFVCKGTCCCKIFQSSTNIKIICHLR